MKQLAELLPEIHVLRMTGRKERPVADITMDSRSVGADSLFVAIQGSSTDGHTYIDQAINRGASIIVGETVPETKDPSVTYIQVKNTRLAMGLIASWFYDHPSSKIRLTGITGTNGKTTSAWLLYELFESMNIPCGLISTIENRIHQERLPATHTTPDAIQLNKLLDHMVVSGCRVCFMEVSSHAIDQQRIAGLTFWGGIFTNITHEHLDYHQTFDAYLAAKKKFFDALDPEAFALVNRDDKHGLVMVQNTAATIYTYSLRNVADFRCKILANSFQGLHLLIDNQEVWFRLVGKFNAYNLLVAFATSMLLGQDKLDTLTGLSRISPIPGRFNYLVSPSHKTAVIDYAHTPDALVNVLETINDIRKHHGRLITVVGAGGNRDTSKRPLMAGIACQLSDRVILTSDNPRFEKPESILEMMKKGVPEEQKNHVLVIPDRKEAIKTAYTLAQPGDIILIAGKGHETTQEIEGVKYPFDDQQIVKELFEIKPD